MRGQGEVVSSGRFSGNERKVKCDTFQVDWSDGSDGRIRREPRRSVFSCEWRDGP